MTNNDRREWSRFIETDAGKAGAQRYIAAQTKRAVSRTLSEVERAEALQLLWGFEGFLKSINANIAAGDQEDG